MRNFFNRTSTVCLMIAILAVIVIVVGKNKASSGASNGSTKPITLKDRA